MYKHSFFRIYKKQLLIALCVLYIVAPLQQQLLEGTHKISHVLTYTSSSHEHQVAHENDSDHGHEHPVVSLLSKLFTEDPQPSETMIIDVKIDKHIVTRWENIEAISTPYKASVFFYLPQVYASNLKNLTPPPEGNFS